MAIAPGAPVTFASALTMREMKMHDDQKKLVTIDYTNWRGKRSIYRIVPIGISFGDSEWHPDTQWLLRAVDVERNVEREFAIKDIHSWCSWREPQKVLSDYSYEELLQEIYRRARESLGNPSIGVP